MSGLGFWLQDVEFTVWEFRVKACGLDLRIQDWVQGSGFRVKV